MADLLVVDDDPDVADGVAEFLRFSGHVVRIAYNGEEGLQHLHVKHPDLVLLDVEMPILGGPGMAYRMFVQDCGMESIPIVLLSGHPDLRRFAERVGTPYFLPKPYTAEDLARMVERALVERIAPRREG